MNYACRIVTLSAKLSRRDVVVRRLGFQLLDSGTSIGANLEEGVAGQSKPDFIAKYCIALKEARETRYWLRVIAFADAPMKPDIAPLVQEASEFIAMLTACVNNARLSANRGFQRV